MLPRGVRAIAVVGLAAPLIAAWAQGPRATGQTGAERVVYVPPPTKVEGTVKEVAEGTFVYAPLAQTGTVTVGPETIVARVARGGWDDLKAGEWAYLDGSLSPEGRFVFHRAHVGDAVPVFRAWEAWGVGNQVAMGVIEEAKGDGLTLGLTLTVPELKEGQGVSVEAELDAQGNAVVTSLDFAGFTPRVPRMWGYGLEHNSIVALGRITRLGEDGVTLSLSASRGTPAWVLRLTRAAPEDIEAGGRFIAVGPSGGNGQVTAAAVLVGDVDALTPPYVNPLYK